MQVATNLKRAMEMEVSLQHKHKHQEFICASISRPSSFLSPSSSASSLQSGPLIARFSADSHGPQLRFRHETESPASYTACICLRSAQVRLNRKKKKKDSIFCIFVWIVFVLFCFWGVKRKKKQFFLQFNGNIYRQIHFDFILSLGFDHMVIKDHGLL